MLEVCGRKQRDGPRRSVIVRPVLAHKAMGEISLFWKFCKKFLSGKAHKNSGRNPLRFSARCRMLGFRSTHARQVGLFPLRMRESSPIFSGAGSITRGR
jgi:hypothetical protein